MKISTGTKIAVFATLVGIGSVFHANGRYLLQDDTMRFAIRSNRIYPSMDQRLTAGPLCSISAPGATNANTERLIPTNTNDNTIVPNPQANSAPVITPLERQLYDEIGMITKEMPVETVVEISKKVVASNLEGPLASLTRTLEYYEIRTDVENRLAASPVQNEKKNDEVKPTVPNAPVVPQTQLNGNAITAGNTGIADNQNVPKMSEPARKMVNEVKMLVATIDTLSLSAIENDTVLYNRVNGIHEKITKNAALSGTKVNESTTLGQLAELLWSGYVLRWEEINKAKEGK